MKVNGVKALCASLKVLDVLAIAIHSPLINNDITIITITANTILVIENIISIPSYIENIFWEITKDIIAKTRLTIPVIIDETVTPKNFPIIISLLFIGKVSKVSNVPLSLSPAVVSVAGYVAYTVIAIIINKNALFFI